MFVLAHLSDPHLGPLPKARLLELAGKRATGFLHWRRTRRLIHRGDVLARLVADVKAQAPDHLAVTGDLVNISLAGEYPPARTWLESLGSSRHVTLVPGNHDAYVRSAAAHPQLHWGGVSFRRGTRSLRARSRFQLTTQARNQRRQPDRPDRSRAAELTQHGYSQRVGQAVHVVPRVAVLDLR